MKKIPITPNKFAIVDDVEYLELSKLKWYAVKSGKTFYAAHKTRTANGKQSTVYMHRIIIDTPPGLFTDHINGNGIDNRKENLRICTQSQNHANRHITNGSSGIKGVSWSKRSKKWEAYIKFNKKKIHIGFFVSKNEAFLAYIKSAKELFGEFARPVFYKTTKNIQK